MAKFEMSITINAPVEEPAKPFISMARGGQDGKSNPLQ